MLRGREREKTVTAKTFENIVFLAEIFGEKADQEIPKVPMLELARSFELSHLRMARTTRRHRRPWALWNNSG